MQIELSGYANLMENASNDLFVVDEQFRPSSMRYIDLAEPGQPCRGRISITPSGNVSLYAYDTTSLSNARGGYVYVL